MRDCLSNRSGFDRILMAVAATFLTVSATSAMAQNDPPRSSAAELAIDAAVPVPDTSNVPPPTIKDFRTSTAVSAPPSQPATADTAKTLGTSKPSEDVKAAATPAAKPADVAATPAPKADVSASATDKTGASKIDASNTNVSNTNSSKSDVSKADAGKTAASNTDANKAAASKADVSKSETGKADAGKADTAAAPATPATAASATAKAGSEPAKDVAKDDATTKADAAKNTTTKESTPEPAKAASNVPADQQPIADHLKEMLAARSLHMFERDRERPAVEKFYEARHYAPIWTHAGQLTDTAKGVIACLKDAAADGLNPDDYPVPDFATATTPDALAEADLKLTNSMLAYARQAQSGRMHWSEVTAAAEFPEHPIDPTEVLRHVTTAKDAAAALDSYNPPQPQYRALKAKLAELRSKSSVPVVKIAYGAVLRYLPPRGRRHPAVMKDARVPKLRARLGIAENADDTRYDARVAEAVRKFQESVDLRGTGILDKRTITALNSPRRDHEIDTVIVNMERWRWLPRNLGAPSLGDAYVILNIPDFTLKVMQHGVQIWKTRVVTGQPGIHATPILTQTMKFITINPTWHVPASIVYKEYLPALQQDPTVLERMGLQIAQNPDGTVRIWQPPGPANALGRIRFNFPNKFEVYQHDTPDKYLFAKSVRAYSHGCMRVQNPDQYAAVLLGITLPEDHYTPAKIRSMYGPDAIDIKFPTPIPVNITYQTAFVDNAGKLEFRRDIYGMDAKMLELLKEGEQGKDLEAVISHPQPNYVAHPVASLPSSVSYGDDGNSAFGSGSPFNFFARLFGPPTRPPAPVEQHWQPHRRLYYTTR